jgi:hypothetical protein
MDALLSDVWPHSWTLLHILGLCAAWSTRLHLNDRGRHFAHAFFVVTFLAIAACAVVSYANVNCSCMLSGTTMGAMVIWAVWESHVEQRQHGHY